MGLARRQPVTRHKLGTLGWLLLAVIAFVQGAMPLLHVWHVHEDVGVVATDAPGSPHRHPPSRTHDETGCAICQSIVVSRQALLPISPVPVVIAPAPVVLRPIADERLVAAAPTVRIGPPRGPPCAL